MTIYSINLGIGWANSGVEYAQLYRAMSFRTLKQPAKFVFTGMILDENIQHFTHHLGFRDDEVIWLYQFFTDIHIAPTTYTLEQVQNDIGATGLTLVRDGKVGRFCFSERTFATIYFVDETSDYVHKVEHVSEGYLIRKDYFTYTKLLSEYFAPFNQVATLYQRRFFNEDGSVAFEEIINEKENIYRLKQHIFYSQEELLAHFIQQLQLTEKDIILLDRETRIAQPVLQNKGRAKVGVIVHAEHYAAQQTTDTHILWNNFYEYPFQHATHIDFFVCATEVQSRLLAEQFQKYLKQTPKIFTVPVGSIPHLRKPVRNRRPFSVMTASRLAIEKHIDWLILAVVKAKQYVPHLVCDIYGEGVEREKLRELIVKHDAAAYIQLKGHRLLADVYTEYVAYASGSTSEGFGLTLLEAVGSGCAMIGLNVPYGNQTFIHPNQNGYLIDTDNHTMNETIDALADRLVALFQTADLASYHEASYRVAEPFLTTHVVQKWQNLIDEVVYNGSVI